MDAHKYFIFSQKRVLVLGILQLACASICVICGFMDALFRKDTPLSASRTPVWGGLVMATPAVLSLCASQRKHSTLVCVLVGSAVCSCVCALVVSGYSILTLTYGEENTDVFHQHDSPEVTFVLHRMVKGANATILLSCCVSLLLSPLIGFTGCRSLPFCGCYDARTGLETLVPQSDPGDTEMVCTWQAGGDSDVRLFNSPATFTDKEPEEEPRSKLPVYSRLT